MVAKHIFVTATNTEIGKTHTTLKLMQAFSDRGLRVGVVKPIETGVVDAPEDGHRLLLALKRLNPEAQALDISAIVPLRMALPAAPFVAKGEMPIDWTAIDRAVTAMDAICDVCLIEGAGGLLVPIDAQYDMIDMIGRFNAKALLVSHCRLGCINDTRLSLEMLRRRDIDFEWVLNCRANDGDFERTSQPYFDATTPEWFMLQRAGDIERLCAALLL